MKKNYISNSRESVRMFKNNILEALSKVHFTVPLYIYIPVIGFMLYKAITAGVGIASIFIYLFFGFFVWTLTEYLLHRFIFHFQPSSKWGQRLHFIFHGVHHDYPRDSKRLVMPPSASIPLALLFYFLFSLFFKTESYLYLFYAGFIAGYLVYDMMHYAMHHYNFKSSLMLRIKHHHMLHHYSDDTRGYGVSSALWDIIFNSGFTEKEQHEPS
ncbi:MAG TPA: sterol desaturase family protein [Chitinophagaceae bacterium]|nr:sterol desaturase family protein [Chitinophagaceae bacterium]